jgi:hypothetical protein
VKRLALTAVVLLMACLVMTPNNMIQGQDAPADEAVAAEAVAKAAANIEDDQPKATSTTMLFGPDGKMLPVGIYRLLVVPHDPNQPVTDQKIVVGQGDDPTPPPPPPGPLEDEFRKAIDSIVDPDKAKTADDLAGALEAPLGMINGGQITTVRSAQLAVQATIDMVLGVRGKTEAWRPFSEKMKELQDGCGDLTRCKSILEASLKVLKEQ